MPFNRFAFFLLFILSLLDLGQILNAQTYTRRNSPYSRYGLGDMLSSQFLPSLSTGGAFAATYNSVWDINLSNPASLGHIESTVFDVAVFYKHSQLKETPNGMSAAANDGNLSYFSLAFPMTKSWDIEKDTLRRAIPIQWGMGFSLSPHSTVGYDTRIVRALPNIGNVEYKYSGEGTRFRANWSNGVRYKGLSVGANLSLLFGTIKDRNVITLQDSAYNFAYNDRVLKSENTLGLLWDLGVQYDLYLKKDSDRPDPNKDMRFIFGAYAGSSSNLQILTQVEQIRYGTYYGIDTLLQTDDSKSYMQLPLTYGLGLAFCRGLKWRLSVNYEAQTWDNFSYSERSIPMGNSYTVSAGMEFTPDYLDFKNYLKRIRYRLGGYYGTDPRIIGPDGENFRLLKYGITFGLGLQMKPRKSSILGYTNISFEYGYLGNPELIQEQFFQVNVSFSLNDYSWFRRSKFR